MRQILCLILLFITFYHPHAFSFLNKKNIHSIRCQKMQSHLYKKEVFLRSYYTRKKNMLDQKYTARLRKAQTRNQSHRVVSIQKWYLRELKQLEYQKQHSQKKLNQKKSTLESLIYLTSLQ